MGGSWNIFVRLRRSPSSSSRNASTRRPVSTRALARAWLPWRLLLQIAKPALVEDAADLDPERCLLVVAVEPIRHRDDPHALEVQLGDDGGHEVVVTSEPREVVDEDDFELPVVSGGDEGG
jgi:hypothetical protein